MKNVSGVVQQLQRELERAKKEVEQFGAALVALGSSSSNGSRRTMSAAARKKISLAQKARWAKQKRQAARPKRTNVSSGSQEDRGCAASKVGESERSEEGSVASRFGFADRPARTSSQRVLCIRFPYSGPPFLLRTDFTPIPPPRYSLKGV
jgi:hypothetical protein